MSSLGYWLINLTGYWPHVRYVAPPEPRRLSADVTTDWVWFDRWGEVHTHIHLKAGKSGVFATPPRAPVIYRSKVAT